jgi:hypothetical protein
MKKFIVKILLFIPFLAFSYTLLLIIWGSFAPSLLITNLNYNIAGYAHMYSRMEEVKQTKDVDILFLGASFAYRGFDPRIFKAYGYKTFNLGSSNQTPVQTQVLLERYLDGLNPKLIVYEVSPRTFTYDGVESTLDVIANDKIDASTLKMVLKINNVRAYNTLLFGYVQQLLNKTQNLNPSFVRGPDTYIPGGYVARTLTYNTGYERYPETRWVPLPAQIESFERVLNMIRKKKIKLCLVQSPVTRVEYNLYKADHARIEAYFSGRAKNYLNFNGFLDLDDSLHFLDNRHLNQDGVEIFNRELIKQIPNLQP